MTFDDCDTKLSCSMFFSLENDGDSEKVVFAAEPVPIPSEFQREDRIQYYFPIVADDILTGWSVGTTVYKDIRDNWDKYTAKAVLITRNGKPNDKNTTYQLSVCSIPAKIKKILDEITPEMIADICENVVSFAEKRYKRVL